MEKKLHGALLAKHMNKIEEIRQKFNVKLIIPPKDSLDSEIFVRGKVADIGRAKKELLELVKQLKDVLCLSFWYTLNLDHDKSFLLRKVMPRQSCLSLITA